MTNSPTVPQVSIINRAIWDAFNAGNLTPFFRDVGLRLANYFKTGKEAWPSHETLAAQARCSERTVRRALAALRELGIFDWSARWIQVGWRKVRTSNLYRRITGQFARGDNKSYQRKSKTSVEKMEAEQPIYTAQAPIRTPEEQIELLTGKPPPKRQPARYQVANKRLSWGRRYPPPCEPVRTPEEQIAILLGQKTPETVSTSATNASNVSPSASVTAVKREA